MSAGHHATGHTRLHVPGDSVVHRLAPEAKLAGCVLFVVIVAVTPRRAVAALLVDAAVVVLVVAAARLRPRLVLSRLAAVVPFLLFGVFVPVFAGGQQVDVLGVALSVEGLWASWGVVSKALIGAAASVVLAATTPIPDLLHAMARLRVPSIAVAIVSFMFRYLEVVADQLARMRRAMTARAHDPRWLWQARPIAACAGTLFVRSYERGEHVQQAMLARGFTGVMPELDERRASARDWIRATVPALVAACALVALVGAR